MLGKLLLISAVALISFEISSATTSNVVCYHGTWAKYRTGNGQFGVANIDTSLCTHLIYAFIGLNSDGTVVTLDSYLDYSLGNLKSFSSLKSSTTKVLVAVGGWNQGSLGFSKMAASATSRATFIQSALTFVQTNNYDGLDFDWEYPAQRGGATADVQNFVTLLQETRAAFEPLGLLITAAVSAAATSVGTSYDVAGIAQYLDLINVMTYDLHGSWDGTTGHNAPLYASSLDTTASALELNVDACISNWIAQGAPAEKIVLGIPFYGRTYTLASTSNVALGAATTGAGISGPYTQESGFLGYNEIVEKINGGGWTYVWDSEQQVPHMSKGDQWVGYDDPKSIALKVQYAQSRGLGGVMVWSIETDDFHGLSGEVNPLLNAISTQMAAGSSSDSSPNTNAAATNSSVGAATTTTTTASPIIDRNSAVVSSICTTPGFVRDSSDCRKFYECTPSNGNLIANAFTCSEGLYFDSSCNVCNWAAEVTDC